MLSDQCSPSTHASNVNNLIMLKLNMTVEKEKNIIYRIIYYYFWFLMNLLELFYRVILYIFEHPGLIKPVAGFFTLLITNIFLFYDFLSPIIDYVLDFLLGYEFFSEFYYWVLNNVNHVLGILWSSFTVLRNILLSLKLFLKDCFYISLFLIKNTWKLLMFLVSNASDFSYSIISSIPDLLNQAIYYISIFMSFFLKSIGFVFFCFLLFYFILYVVDFIELIIKKKILIKIFRYLSNICSFLRGAVKFFLNILFCFLSCDLLLDNKYINNSIKANKETKLELLVRKRTVSFNETVTIIPIDTNESGCGENSIDYPVGLASLTNCEFLKNKHFKNYRPVETFATIQDGIQRLKDYPLENQYYVKK